MTSPVINLRQWGHRMEAALSDQTMESHLLGALLAADVSRGMVTAGMWILNDNSMISRIANMSSYPVVLAYLWMSLALLVVPYFAMQVFGSWLHLRRQITRLACRAILFSGVLWAYLGYLSRSVDAAGVTGVFLINSITCVLMSALLASSINTAQAREEQHKES